MWLIDVWALTLVYKSDPSDVSYVTLSHTWGNEEISFRDFQDLKTARYKAGFEKIVATCRLARKRNIDYAWIDTCCIDRTSSAELTEAINSMFRIYEASAVCFVYLSDLPSLPHLPPGSRAPPYTASRGSDQETTGTCEPQGFAQVPPLLRRCKWFTRGWTLQELIAPKRVEFHDRFWYFRGSKSLWIKPLAEITGIHPRALASSRKLDEHSVAARFSWAAQRQTTRVEDIAYCLLGIFGVHMPLIYGEHVNAFIRLQEEICKKTNDLSLFSWTAQPHDNPQDSIRGLFATTPAEFAQCADVVRLPSLYARDGEFAATNKGLCFHAPLVPSGIRVNLYVMPLECSKSYNLSPGGGGGKTATARQPVGIYLTEVGARFVRARPEELHIFADAKAASAGGDTSLSLSTAIYARGTLSRTEAKGLAKELSTRVVAIRLLLPGGGIKLLQKEPRAAWHAPQAAFCTARAGRREGFLCFWLVHVKAQDIALDSAGDGDSLKGRLQTLRHPAFQCLVVCVLDAERRTYVWTEQEEDRWRTASPVARPIVGRGMKSKLGALHQGRDTTATVTVSAPKIIWVHGGDGRCDLEFSVTHNAVAKP